MAEAHPRGPGHETADVNARAVVLFLVGLAVTLGLVHLGLTALFGHFAAREARRDAALPSERPAAAPLVPEPILQVEPRLDLVALRAEEESVLSSYAWVDSAGGRIRSVFAEAGHLRAGHHLRQSFRHIDFQWMGQ
jgi:hypothetical protein